MLPLLLACAAHGPADPASLDRTADTAALEVVPAADPVQVAPDTESLCQLALDCPTMPTYDVREACTHRVETAEGRVDWDGAAEVWIRGDPRPSSPSPAAAWSSRPRRTCCGWAASGTGSSTGCTTTGCWCGTSWATSCCGRSGGYAAESALREMTLNGAYFGVHSLGERIERDDDRLDIADGSASGDAFVATQSDHECFHTNTTTYGCWKLVSPDDDALTPDARLAVEGWFTDWEASITAGDPVEPFIDTDRTVDAVLIEEFFKNEDAFYTSRHAWRDAGGTLGFVPWALDRTFGQFPYYPGGDYSNPHLWIDYRPQLWATIGADPAFHARLVARWAELRAGSLATGAVLARIDALQTILGDAPECLYTRHRA